jgi:hypothetical protein
MSTLFTCLSSLRIAAVIRTAKSRVCYAAPGIQLAPAQAIAEVSKRISSDELTVSLDFNEASLRMGYGSLDAVKLLTSSGIELRNSPGLRSAFLIVDDKGWVFTPTALLLEPEPQSDETPNALALTPQQISEVMLRVSPVAREEAIAAAATPEAKAAIASTVMEIGVVKVGDSQLAQVSKAIEQAPPVAFDLARQVRVFQPYLQYVEIELTGAKIQSHRSQIPPNIQQLGTGKDLEGKLRTTFQLIGKSNELTSEKLDKELDEIRKNFTRTIGKQERVILKSARPTFDARIEAFKTKLEAHKAAVKSNLEQELKKSREEVVEYYLPLARSNPPDALVGQSLFSNPDDAEIRSWLNRELGRTFPTADSLINEMKFDVRFKDVTFETLNRPDFIDSLKDAYPTTPWEKAYKEFQAMAEREKLGEKPNP